MFGQGEVWGKSRALARRIFCITTEYGTGASLLHDVLFIIYNNIEVNPPVDFNMSQNFVI